MGFGDYLTQTFPAARVTSGKRDPNSRLGRANPRSFHNIGQAWDVAPIPGMTFDQYRDRVKQDGWNVREAIDEVKNPSRHATGPHWHMAVDGRKEQQPMATSLSSLMQNNPTAMSPRQFLQRPMEDPQMQMSQASSLASYLQAPLTNEAIQPAQMPNPQAGFVDMAPVEGVKPKGRGTANDIIGSLGDFLASAFGGQPQYWSGVNEQQQLETQGRQRLAERQAERKTALEDWLYKQRYEADNKPNQFLSTTKDWQALSPEEKAAYAAMMDVKSPIAVSGPQGTYRVPRGFGQPTNAPAVQPGAVEDGYQFTGGDPSNPSNWRKVQ